MSKERQRAREARQAARRAEVAAAAEARARQAKRTALRQRLTPTPRRRPRRYRALTPLARLRLVLVFLVVQALTWPFLNGIGPHLAMAVLTVASLLVIVRTRRSPAR